jgi:hypothetical protein
MGCSTWVKIIIGFNKSKKIKIEMKKTYFHGGRPLAAILFIYFDADDEIEFCLRPI